MALHPNPEMAQAFLSVLARDEPVTFQTFDDDKERKRGDLVRVRHGSLSDHASELVTLNNSGAGVFVMVNAGDGRVHAGERTCRATPSVVGVRSCFVDLDGAPLQPVLRGAAKPHIVVASSPNRWHAYWLMKDCPLEKFAVLQAALQSKFDGDTVKDLPRVMRLPGFIHRKEKPFMSRLMTDRELASLT